MAKMHAERRLEIIMTARDLFLTRGYETCTINDIIDAVGIAKGTFYHYFKGKEELLGALIDHLSDEILAQINVIAEDHTRSALDRLTAYFQQSITLKAQNREIMLVLLRTMYRPENTLLRVGMIEKSNQRIAPVLGAVVREGVEAGEFDVEDAEMCGEYIIRSFSTLSERAGRAIIGDPDSPELLPELHRIYDFMEWSLARLLGVDRSSVTIADRAVADRLFGTIHKDTVTATEEIVK